MAKGVTSAPSTWKLRSGTEPLASPGAPSPEIGEEAVDLLPHGASAGEPLPLRPDDADQAEALVDRHEEASGRADPRRTRLTSNA